MKTKLYFFSILFVQILTFGDVWAETYWITNNAGGKTSLINCKGSTPLSGTEGCYYAAVDYDGSIIVAGDTVYFRAGDYSFSSYAISPTNNGSSTSNLITYSSYNSEDVNFTSTSAVGAINLGSKSYIKIHGIDFVASRYGWTNFLNPSGAHHIEISHCTFIGHPDNDWSYRAINVQNGSQYFWIHDCTIGNWSNLTYPIHNEFYGNAWEYGSVINIGWDSGDDASHYNILENCNLYYAGHDVLGVHSKYNIIRNNYIHNEVHLNDGTGNLFSQRNVYLIGTYTDQHNVFEGNKIGYSGYPRTVNNCSNEGIVDQGNYNIFRYNEFYQNAGNGYSRAIKPITNLANGSVIYNNTFWHNGYDPYTPNNKTTCFFNSYTASISTCDDSSDCKGNSYVNNIFYQNKNAGGNIDISTITKVAKPIYQDIRSNWNEFVNGDPKFMSISGTPDPKDPKQFNFNLQSDSGAINKGTYFTQAKGSGNSATVLAVYNASYFQDGFGLASAWPTANIQADWIAVGSVSNVAQIKSINYSTNEISMVTPLTWSNNAPVWLYKNSKGTQVLYGSAPDLGANENEYMGGINIPTGLRILPVE